jgi:hypothetical protein
VKINDVEVVKADIVTNNGVIHVIDKVLLPIVGETEALTSPVFFLWKSVLVRAPWLVI